MRVVDGSCVQEPAVSVLVAVGESSTSTSERVIRSLNAFRLVIPQPAEATWPKVCPSRREAAMRERIALVSTAPAPPPR